MRLEWTEHPSKQRKPLRRALLAYVREIKTMAALVAVMCTVNVVVFVEHVAGVVVGDEKSGGVKLMVSEWMEHPLE